MRRFQSCEEKLKDAVAGLEAEKRKVVVLEEEVRLLKSAKEEWLVKERDQKKKLEDLKNAAEEKKVELEQTIQTQEAEHRRDLEMKLNDVKTATKGKALAEALSAAQVRLKDNELNGLHTRIHGPGEEGGNSDGPEESEAQAQAVAHTLLSTVQPARRYDEFWVQDCLLEREEIVSGILLEDPPVESTGGCDASVLQKLSGITKGSKRMAKFMRNLVAALEILAMAHKRKLDLGSLLDDVRTLATNELWFWAGQEDIDDDPMEMILPRAAELNEVFLEDTPTRAAKRKRDTYDDGSSLGDQGGKVMRRSGE